MISVTLSHFYIDLLLVRPIFSYLTRFVLNFVYEAYFINTITIFDEGYEILILILNFFFFYGLHYFYLISYFNWSHNWTFLLLIRSYLLICLAVLWGLILMNFGHQEIEVVYILLVLYYFDFNHLSYFTSISVDSSTILYFQHAYI